LLTKLFAVELVSISKGCETPGIDDLCFLTVPPIVKTKANVLKYLHDLIKKLKYDISLSEGYTNQVNVRKGINHFNSREIYRRYLKSKKGKFYIKNCKNLFHLINKIPIEYLSNIRLESIKNNLKLKFKLLNCLTPPKINNYEAGPILRVYISKNMDKLRSLGIPTLKDRTMQTFLKLVIEPYMETLGDRNSFGFRPGRNCHKAVSYLYSQLFIRISSTSKHKRILFRERSVLSSRIKKYKSLNKYKNKQEQLLNNKNRSNKEIQNLLATKKQYYVPFHLLNTNIDNCFDKINHN
jgi:hypothetical protein